MAIQCIRVRHSLAATDGSARARKLAVFAGLSVMVLLRFGVLAGAITLVKAILVLLAVGVALTIGVFWRGRARSPAATSVTRDVSEPWRPREVDLICYGTPVELADICEVDRQFREPRVFPARSSRLRGVVVIALAVVAPSGVGVSGLPWFVVPVAFAAGIWAAIELMLRKLYYRVVPGRLDIKMKMKYVRNGKRNGKRERKAGHH